MTDTDMKEGSLVELACEVLTLWPSVTHTGPSQPPIPARNPQEFFFSFLCIIITGINKHKLYKLKGFSVT